MALRNDEPAARGAGVFAIAAAALGFTLGPMALGNQGGDEPRREAIPSDRGTDFVRGGGRRDTVSLPAGATARLGIRVEPARAATRPGTLVLRGRSRSTRRTGSGSAPGSRGRSSRSG